LIHRLRFTIVFSGLLIASTAASMPADVAPLLHRTVWVDIGIGRTLQSLSPKDVAMLKRCREPTMGFETRDGRWVQTFYSGIAMRTEYVRAMAEENSGTTTIRFFSQGRSTPAETVRLLKGNTVLVQEAPGFHPHMFLKCTFAPDRPIKR
jgi:hypothetical protein